MRALSRLGAFRALAESRMTSRVAVMRKTGETAQNETTGLQDPVWATVHVDLPFRLDNGGGGLAQAGGSGAINIGGVELEVAVAVANLPATTDDLADGDLIEVISGEWADTVWRIVKATTADQKTARRVPLEGATRPSEWGA
ncbi:MAG TPA: DUF6093 family protein [Aeromicrobium sp.]|nr:DUF6093 family protein [Aeromicrobium sp.]HKY58303.1 DUF6093 family protein [Aeromicrobium sp.]